MAPAEESVVIMISVPDLLPAVPLLLDLEPTRLRLRTESMVVVDCEMPSAARSLLDTQRKVLVVNVLQPGALEETFQLHEEVERADVSRE